MGKGSGTDLGAADFTRHAASLRALARALQDDESLAEDLVQEAWVRARGRGPEEGRSRLAWLRAVVRNLARERRREERRRRAREERAARPERADHAALAAERAELQRELAGIVLALDEPYRSAVLLRYFEDLPPRRIAAQLGVPVATVHTRLARGRERVRAELERRHGRGGTIERLGALVFVLPRPSLRLLRRAAAVALPLGGAAGVVAVALVALRSGDDEARARRPESAAPELARAEPRRTLVSVVEPAASVDDEAGERDAPATAAPAAPRAPTVAPATSDAPPGLVPVAGGSVQVGSTIDEVVELVQADESRANVLVAETPRHAVSVADFLLVPTEVTNEQYAEFVRATGRRPPESWATEAIDAARREHLEARAKVARAARARGAPAPTREPFDPRAWWRRSWRGEPWSVPEEGLERPVTHVSFEDAAAYAAWAGLRLPTEEELQAAARGETDAPYPWGEDEDVGKYAASLQPRREEPWPVGSFPAGARAGIFDLSGNVWEWTASRFTAHPGYRDLEIEIGTGPDALTLAPRPPFDAERRVAVGGGFVNGALELRVTTRNPLDPDFTYLGLGFRCAASPDPARDAAEALVLRLGREGEALAPERGAALTRWRSRRGAGERLPVAARVPAYDVITRHDEVVLVPAARPPDGAGDARVAAFRTTVPLTTPAAPPATGWIVRAADGALVLAVGGRRTPLPAARLRPATRADAPRAELAGAELRLAVPVADPGEPGALVLELALVPEPGRLEVARGGER